MKLQSIIVEDEKASRDILKNYISKYCPDVHLVGEAQNIEEAILLIRQNDLDLVFLDVEMPYGNAFDLLEKIGIVDFETIFVTAYNHYAIEALNAHASYYLTKPISIDELIKGVDYVKQIKLKEKALHDKILMPRVKPTEAKITLPQQDGFEVIKTSDILYCQADDNYTYIYLLNNKKKLVSKTLKYFDDALKDYGFSRIHKSYLVNVNEIVKYIKGKGGSVVLSNGKQLSVSASKKADFLNNF